MSSVLLALIYKDYKGRSSKGALSILASLLQPLIRTIFFSLIWYFTGRTSFNGISTVHYIAAGVFCYMMIHVVMRRLPAAIGANQGLLGFPQVKPIDALLSRFIVELMLLVVAFGSFMFLLYWFLGITEHVREPLPLLGILFICFMMSLGIGLIFGVYGHLYSGVRTAVAFTTLPIFLTSGALHPVAGLATEVRELLSWNPLFHIIDYVRHYWFGTRLIPEHNLFYAEMFAMAVLSLGVLAYYNNRIVLVQR